jgi:hypothetical protein
MITIDVGLDCKLLSITQCLLSFLQPKLDGAHNILEAETSRNTREHLLGLAILSLGGITRYLMGVALELN